MSRYGLNSALWGVYTSAENAQKLRADPAKYLEQFDLADAELEAIATQDYGELLELGAHPFLMYKMALRLAGGFSMEFLLDYLGPLQGHGLRDVVT